MTLETICFRSIVSVPQPSGGHMPVLCYVHLDVFKMYADKQARAVGNF